MLKIKKPRTRTWIARFKEVMSIKNVEGGKVWLEKEAKQYRKQNPGMTTWGARIAIKSNLTYIAQRFYSQKENDHLKKIIGISSFLFQ